MKSIANIFLIIVIVLAPIFAPFTLAQSTTNVDAYKLLSRVNVAFSPRAGTFVEGSVFDVPILVNTKGRSINGIEITVNYDRNKLSIIRPSGGTSIIGVWVEPPTYDNARGFARYVGVIPNGITTESGLIGNITFQAKAVGPAVVSFASSSKILLNDGLGTEAIVEFDRGQYTITPKAPLGVNIFSDTHPFQSDWYNNPSPVISWEKGEKVEGFSFVFDNVPNTVPDNTIDIKDTTKSFENLTDGLWYFHIKASKEGVWGTTGTFLVRVDTAPPAEFKPKAEYLLANGSVSDQALISFFTTDNLSGIDHYEVGVIDKSQPATVSPVFTEAETPFQIPLNRDSRLEVIVRAVDQAGNVRDQSVNVKVPSSFVKFVSDYKIYILIAIIILGLLVLISHYLFGHHIIRHALQMLAFIRREEEKEDTKIEKKIEKVESEEEKAKRIIHHKK